MTPRRRNLRNLTASAAVMLMVITSLTACQPAANCPCTLFTADQSPVIADSGDSQAAEVGVRFTSDVGGFISGVRFYKSSANTGTHIGNLWTASGHLLATATFSNETASGWQQVDFANPVPIAARGTYIASYHTDVGHYSADAGFFDTPLDRAPLHAPADGTGGQGNGVYHVGASGFPDNSYRSINYWVDPVLVTTGTDTVAPTVIGKTPAASATNVAADTTVTAQFSEPVQNSSLTVTDANGVAVVGGLAYDGASMTDTFTPAAPFADGTYEVTVAGAEDGSGNPLAAPVTWSFTVGNRQCPCSLWSTDTVPATPDANATAPAEVGTRFSSDTAGYVTAVRFYKSVANTGTHIGHVWNDSGTLLGTAVFTDESASGWQTATFPDPIPVTPGMSYVVSYFAPDGHYAADNGYFANSGVDNRPLHANQDADGQSNGVYNAGTSAYPASSWQSTNYWVDVVFDTTATGTVPPTVLSTNPSANATGVPVGAPVSATFSEPVQPDTVDFSLVDGTGATVAGSASYDADTLTETFQPSAPLDPRTTYTASVSGAKDVFGNTMVGAVTWSFTPQGTTSLWGTPTPQIVDTGPSGPLELGVRFSTDSPGFVTGVRFYKSAANTGTHIGNLWAAGGQILATATFTDETASGWQQVNFDHPVPLSVGGTYIASYHTDSGHYSADPGYFANSGWCAGPLCAYRDGDGGGNGVFADGASSFPTQTYGSTNYWVDPIFDASAVDPLAPELLTQAPAPGATDVATQTLVTAGFSTPIVASSAQITVTASNGVAVAGTVSYDAPSRVLTFSPAAPLSPSMTYTAHLSGARDPHGLTVAPTSWTFTTSAAVPLGGTGGPVLVVTNSSDPSGEYLGEILRTEGLNLFATADISSLTPATLSGYSVVVLAPTPVTPTQVTMLSDWVSGGGHLIGIRPDAALAGLFGLTPLGTTLSDAYLEIDPTSAAGAGLVDQTIQFHGSADLYALDGATSVATLYSNATTATTSPAVTERAVGTGSAAAFTYDLDRSIIETRQGNPAWAGQHRLGTSPIRATDLFYGASATDPEPNWVDLTKIAIPQADVQQRLLANLIITMESTTEPIPRFWYLPNGAKAAVVLTGDDHGHGGTSGRFDQLQAESPPGCSVTAWTCLRATSYLFPGTPITAAQAALYTAAGFEIGLHPTTDCNDFTDTGLDADFTSQLAALAAQLPGIPAPATSRTHCVPWSDWSGEPRVELAHGIRLDMNYYWWPPQLSATNPGLFTGSGIPMRFADTDGSLIDVYQVPTQVTDESGQPEPSTIDTLLANATGPLGYYAVIGVNAHTDSAESATADAVVAAAGQYGVPVISAVQLLRWLDARGESSFAGLSWSDGTEQFSISAASEAVGLQTLVPATSGAAPFSAAAPGTLQQITVNGTPVPFTIQTIKGVTYAVFTAANGDYDVTYGAP